MSFKPGSQLPLLWQLWASASCSRLSPPNQRSSWGSVEWVFFLTFSSKESPSLIIPIFLEIISCAISSILQPFLLFFYSLSLCRWVALSTTFGFFSTNANWGRHEGWSHRSCEGSNQVSSTVVVNVFGLRYNSPSWQRDIHRGALHAMFALWREADSRFNP